MPNSDDPLAERLAAIREHIEAAPAGPYKVDERHGRDIADEGWSEVRVVGPDGRPLAATYITSILEPDAGDDVTGFLVAARSELPLLAAAVEAVLEVARKLEPQGPSASALEEDRMWVRQQCAEMIRAAITRALAGDAEDSRPDPAAPAAPPGSSETESAYVLRRLAETAAGLPATVLPLTGPERDHLGAEFRREYREARAPGKDGPA